jgi:hypothetical protein
VAFLIAIFGANNKPMALSNNEIKIKYVIDDTELRKAATSFDNLTKEEQDAINSMKKFNTELSNTGAKATETGNKVKGAFDKAQGGIDNFIKGLGPVGPAIAGAFAATSIISFGKAVFDVTANFEKLAAVLKNTLGSGAQASLALESIKEFAKTTPFSVQELTASFVKLANQGFRPTTEQMRKLGDLASSTGKQFDQLTEAIIDAQVGEFERLKEFGIRAQKQGDQVTFTFKGVQTQVKFTNEAIREYITSLGDYNGVAGSAAAVSETLGGKVNNLGDAWDNFLNSIGTLLKPVLAGALSTTAEVMDKINALFKLGTTTSQQLTDIEVASFQAYQKEVTKMTDDMLDAQLKRNDQAIKELSAKAAELGKKLQGVPSIAGFDPALGTRQELEAVQKGLAMIKGENAAITEQINDRQANITKYEELMARLRNEATKDKEAQQKIDEKNYQLKLKQLQIEKEILILQAQLRGEGPAGAEKVIAEKIYQLKKDNLGKIKDLTEQEVTAAELGAQAKAKAFEEASQKEKMTTKNGLDYLRQETDKNYAKGQEALDKDMKQRMDKTKAMHELELEELRKQEELKQEIRNKAVELGQTVVTGAFDLYQAQLNNEMSSLQKRYDEEIRLADGNKQKITEINERKAASERDIKLKQFRAEQLNAVANIWFQAAPQIVKYGANPATIPLAVLVASIAAAQTGFVAAQPVPEFAEGTKGKPFKGGKAIVGERGVEKVVTESGKVYFTPPTATLVDLPKGSQVIPNHALSKQELFMASHYASRSNSTASPVVGELRELGSIIRALPITQLNMDERGFEKYIRTPRRTTKVLNNRFRSGES